jgi:uncharacterized protein involved in exopolysaccharide biosynthesis
MNPRPSTPHAVEDDRRGLTDQRDLQSVSSLENSTPAMERARLLWANRSLLGRASLVGLIAGALIALLVPSRYESTLQLMPPDSQSNTGMAMLAALAAKSVAQSAGGAGAIAGDLLGIKSSGSLFLGILRSRTVEDRLIRRFQLKSVYRTKLDEDARKELVQNSGVSEDRKSGILTLTVNDRDAQRARAMATAYAEELNRLVAELSTSAAHRERVFLEERLVAVKQDLDQAARDLGDFSSKNATLDVKEQGRTMVQAAAALQGELIAAESQRRGLEAIYTPNNVRVRAAEARASELRRQLEKLGGKGGEANSEADGENALYPSLRRLPILGVKYAELYRRAKIQEVVYETLTQQYEIAKVQEAKETPSVKILDEASLPERHSFPPRMLITFLCGFAALLFASMWIVARHRWESTVSHDPRKQFAQEVFHGVNSIMPWATPNGSRWQAASHRVWVRVVKRGQQGPGTDA